MRRYRILNPPDDENIYGNITNNDEKQEDGSLNELKDLAVEINDEDLNIDLEHSHVPVDNNGDLYQFDTNQNETSGIEYHEQLPYENTQDISYNAPNTEEAYEPNDITVDGYNDIPSEENETMSQDKILDDTSSDELISQNDIPLEYHDDEIDSQINNTEDVSVEMPEEQEYTEPEEFQEGYAPKYEDINSSENEDGQEDKKAQPKKSFTPILMAVLAILIFFAVLNLPQVKEKINGNSTDDIQNEQIEEMDELSNLNKSPEQIDEASQNKRAKMVVFDEDQKENETTNVKICANPFLPTVSIATQNENSLGAYEIISPPSVSEIDNSVEVSAMMETKVSGILYDRDNPQAILNYDGQDQLVRRGDRLAGFYVMSITPDKVILKQGNNIYRVSVGQAVTDEGINYNVNSNLGKQFGGRYKNIKGRIININE